jgi:hypothetical protein
VQAGRAHRDHRVTHLDPVPAEDLALLDHTDTGGRDVVLVRAQHAGVLGGLAAQQRAAGVAAAVRDARADLRHLVRHDLAAGDVVEQEQRLGAAGDQVVDDHRHEVDAHRVVDVELLRDDQLGAHAVGRGRQDRVLVLLHVEAEQAGEAADASHHLGPHRAVHVLLELRHRLLTGVDRHPRLGVRDGARPRRPLGAGNPGCAVGLTPVAD